MNTNTHFVIGIRNKIPYKISGPDYIVTDNSDYTLELVPDEQWEGMETKTVIYAYDNGTAVHNPINGNQDKIPIIQASGNLHIGVTAGDIRTSTWVSVPIRGSIRRKAGAGINPPAPDVYDKIMDMLNDLDNRIDTDLTEVRNELDQLSAAIAEKVGTAELKTAVETALTEAKESGEFKGEKGDPGQPGAPGADYVLTEYDKTEIAQAAAALVDTALLSIIGSGVTA